MAVPLGTDAIAPASGGVQRLPAQQDGAGVVAVLAEVGGGAARIEPLHGIKPGQLVGAFSRGQHAVAIHPTLAAVVGRQDERPAIAVAGGLVSGIEPAVIGDQGPQRPARVEWLGWT
ncbi:hypothetical protein FQZ97_498120 [compost metagenome]